MKIRKSFVQRIQFQKRFCDCPLFRETRIIQRVVNIISSSFSNNKRPSFLRRNFNIFFYLRVETISQIYQ